MANLDFTPLYRSTIGFDRLPNMLQTAMKVSGDAPGFPPYDIVRVSNDEYRIVFALAGFAADDIEITAEQNRLSLRCEVPKTQEVEYLHRGIAGRSFERHFDLADFIEVKDATFQDGLLTIGLQRELPEKLKPRRIDISAGGVKGILGKAAKKAA